jgi:tRNA modification GTPase
MKGKKTIAAIATPPGDGGVGIVRISGAQSIEIASKLLKKDLRLIESHKITFTQVIDADQQLVDEVIAFKMESPRSFTGEDVVEIQCHGGQLVVKKILSLCLAAGAQIALPGEFTQRAFMNGKIDLAKAESIQMMIHAKNTSALKAAKSQLEGQLSSKILHFQEKLFYLAAILEAWVDYPEEGLEFMSNEEFLQQLHAIKSQLRALENSFEVGRKLNTSTRLCIIGAPNVGKSSLLNALMQKERAIVSDIAGTTRDVIEGEITIRGHHFTIVDTAGVRTTTEVIEQEGIRRSLIAKDESDLVLVLIDGSRPLTQQETILLRELDPEKTIVVTNKADIVHPLHADAPILISAKTLQGIDILQKVFIDWIEKQNGLLSKEEVILVQKRHYEAIKEALTYLDAVEDGLVHEIGGELVVMDIKAAIHALAQIIGRNVTEEVLDQIFSNFCVGK